MITREARPHFFGIVGRYNARGKDDGDDEEVEEEQDDDGDDDDGDVDVDHDDDDDRFPLLHSVYVVRQNDGLAKKLTTRLYALFLPSVRRACARAHDTSGIIISCENPDLRQRVDLQQREVELAIHAERKWRKKRGERERARCLRRPLPFVASVKVALLLLRGRI